MGCSCWLFWRPLNEWKIIRTTDMFVRLWSRILWASLSLMNISDKCSHTKTSRIHVSTPSVRGWCILFNRWGCVAGFSGVTDRSKCTWMAGFTSPPRLIILFISFNWLPIGIKQFSFVQSSVSHSSICEVLPSWHLLSRNYNGHIYNKYHNFNERKLEIY